MSITVAQLLGEISIKGVDTAKSAFNAVGTVATALEKKLSSFKPFDAGKSITNEDAAKAKLKLIELDVEKAKATLQKLEKAADAGQAVEGIEEARAKLTLLEKDAQDAREAIEDMGKAANETGNRFSLFSGMASKLGSTLSQVGSIGKNAAGGLVSGFMRLGPSLAGSLSSIGFVADGIRAIADAAVGLGKALFSQNASLEQTRVSFFAFLESTELVNQALKDLRQFAAQTPFSFPEIQQASLKLLNMGVASQNLTKYLNNIGNGVAKIGGSGQVLNEVVMILNQMTMKGQVYAEEMQQLSERNIPAYKLLAEAMGVSTAELQRMMQAGEVGADKVDLLIEAMGKFGNGAMQAQSRTMVGLWSAFTDNVKMGWAAFTGSLFNQAKGGLEQIGALVASPRFEQFATVMGDRVGGALQRVSSFLQTNVTPFFRDLWAIINDEPFGMLMVNLKDLGGALLEVVQSASPLLNVFRDTEAETRGGMSPAIASLATAMYKFSAFIEDTLVPVLNDISDFFSVIIPPASKVLEDAMDGVAGVIEKVRDPLGKLLDKLGPLIAGFFDWSDKGDIVKNALSLLGDVLATLITKITDVVDGIQKVTNYFKENETAANALKISLIAVGGALAGIQVQQMATGLPGLIKKIGEWTVANWALAVSAWAAAGPWVIAGALIGLVVGGIILAIQNWGTISQWLADRWETVKTFFVDLWGKISEVFSTIGKWFTDRFTEAKDGVMTAFKPLIQWFTDRWNELTLVWNYAPGYFKRKFDEAWTNITNVFSSIGQWFSDRWEDVKRPFVAIGQWFSARFDEVMAPLRPIAAYFGAVFETLWNIIVAIFGKIGQWFSDRFNEAKTNITLAFSFIGQWAQDRWKEITGVFAVVGQWFTDRFNEAKTAITIAFSFIGQWAQDRWKEITQPFIAVGQWFSDRFNEAKAAMTVALSFIGQWAQDRWKEVTAAFSVAGTWFSDRFNEAKNAVMRAFEPIARWFGDRWTEIKTGVTTAWNAVKNIIGEKAHDIKEGILKPFNDAKNAIGSILKGLANAAIDQLNNGIGAFESFLNFFGDALNGIAKNLGTEGVIPKVTLSRIPKLAEGTDYHPGGPALIAEAGRELAMVNGRPMLFSQPQIANLPRGTTVLPNAQTEMALSLIPRGAIPGYADGIGEAWTQFWSWVASGAQSLLDSVLNTMGIKGFSLPGKLNEIPGAVFGNIKDWAVDLIGGWLPKIDFGGGNGDGVTPTENVKKWIAQAISIAKVPGDWAGSLMQIAMHESGGNPGAKNDWDINAINGDPSIGLMQTIGATFRAHMLAGYNDIYNPVHNAVAAIRYIQSRYGTVFSVPGIVALSQGKGYVGYANGGIISETIAGIGASGQRYLFGEAGPEAVVPLNRMPAGTGAFMPGSSQGGQAIHIHVTVSPELSLDGYKLSRGLMPYTVDLIRSATGANF